MTQFATALKNETNFTLTENGAVALKTTDSSLLDLFGTVGGLRNQPKEHIELLFSKAFAEDSLLATKLAFHARNVRGGVGERQTFRIIIKQLAQRHPDIVEKNLANIAFFGRFDDLYELVGTPVEKAMFVFMKAQLFEDIANMKQNKPTSIMAKWLKSINASSVETVRLGKLTAKAFGMTEAQYRRVLSALRKHIDVVETKMSSNEWGEINYSAVTSKAMSNYYGAFKKHDNDRFEAFKTKVEKGEAKVNASTLFPYDLMEKMGLHEGYSRATRDGYPTFKLGNPDRILEAQWKALPDYVKTDDNILIMADTSGSMSGRPIATSIGLATYFAERNHGAFKDMFLTFSSKPSLVQLKGETLADKVSCIPAIISHTDLEAAFDLILETALKNRIPQSEMPKALIIISDMQFDGCVNRGRTFYDSMSAKFARCNYTLPNVVFWDVANRRDTFQVDRTRKGVQLVSGHSVAIFKGVLQCIGFNPYDAMLETLNDPMYDRVVV